MDRHALTALRLSRTVNRWVERLCVALLVLLVLDVWLGVLARYVLPFNLTFTEELARYLMIWVALLAISSGISHREHIGMVMLFERFPAPLRKWVAIGIDLAAFSFFAILLIHGLGLVERGFSRFTMINEIPKAYPFMIVPLASALACLQLALVAIHDFFSSDGITAADRAVI